MNKILYSPWRLKYILMQKKAEKCIFCLKPAKNNDIKHLILYRSKHSFVIMNLYPYNNGHLMIVPKKHVALLDELTEEEYIDLFLTLKLSNKIMNKVYNPEGINIGLNLGKAAGAGIDEHLHIHIVPRWQGDVNFMTTIGETRVIPESFETAYKKLKKQFEYEKEKK